jgi:hypothetical protein
MQSILVTIDWKPLRLGKGLIRAKKTTFNSFLSSFEWVENTIKTKLTPCSRVLLERLRVTQLVKKFPAFYGNRRFITVFTRARLSLLSRVRWIQSTNSHPIFLRSTIILSSRFRLDIQCGLFPWGFPTNILYALLISPMPATRTYPAHPMLLDLSP